MYENERIIAKSMLISVMLLVALFAAVFYLQ
jgi:hypothetical protein